MANGVNPWTAFWNQRESGDRAVRMKEAQAEQAQIEAAQAAAPSKYQDSSFVMPSVGNLYDNVKYGVKSYIPGTDENKIFTDSIGSLWGDMQTAGTRTNLEAEIAGGARLAPGVAEAGDYVDGADYDKWAQDFTKEDIVNTIAGPTKPGKQKTPKKTMKRRAAVQKAVAPKAAPAKRFATVDPLNLFGNKNGVNPFASGGGAITNDRFNGGVVPAQKPAPKAAGSKFVNSALDLF